MYSMIFKFLQTTLEEKYMWGMQHIRENVEIEKNFQKDLKQRAHFAGNKRRQGDGIEMGIKCDIAVWS